LNLEPKTLNLEPGTSKMAEIKEFVVNDRRKFTAEGEVRPDAPPSVPKPPRPETLQPATPSADEFNSSARLTPANGPQAVPNQAPPASPEPLTAFDPNTSPDPNDQIPPPPTADQTSQAQRAFDATVDRLDTAIRAANPGMEPLPEMTFDRVVQSLYMQALMQLGGASAPGQHPQVDLLGARQTIDMLAVIASRTTNNLSPAESTLVDTALFELHMGFLEVTQAMARQAATRPPATPPTSTPTGPTIVR
jgi:hypothetical protein